MGAKKKEIRPLRKVMGGYWGKDGGWREVLECGHELRERQDIYGATNALRRRCRHCVPKEKTA